MTNTCLGWSPRGYVNSLIRLGLMKKFVKTMSKEREVFKYLKTIIPELSDDELKEAVIIDQQIRKD